MTKLIKQQSTRIQLPVRAIAHKLLVGISLFVLGFTTVACSPANSAAQVNKESAAIESVAIELAATESAAISATTTKEVSPETVETATFAGGCFWCMEPPFDALPGVLSTTSGYTGGQVANPTYTQVSNGNTGHFEAMQVTYDPSQVAYETLLDTFWHNIDPLDNQGQFCDKGSQYRSAIFYDTTEQRQLAEAAKQTVASQLGSPVATEILPAAPFYPAEDYHQDYYQTHPVRYRVYRFGCGRDQRLSEVWGEDAAAHD